MRHPLDKSTAASLQIASQATRSLLKGVEMLNDTRKGIWRIHKINFGMFKGGIKDREREVCM